MSTDPRKFERDQQHDKEKLKKLRSLFTIIKSSLERSAYDRSSFQGHLRTVSNVAKNIRWNVKDGHYLRNKIGRFNYGTDKENKVNYIDLGLLENMSRILDRDNTREHFTSLLLAQKDELIKEITVIQQTIGIHLSKLGQVSLIEGDGIEFSPASRLYNSTHYWLDCVVISDLNRFISSYKSIADDYEDWEKRYHAARLITILGESIKLLSPHYKEEHACIPLQSLIRLRDKIAHQHRKYVGRPSVDFAALIPKFLHDSMKNIKQIVAGLEVEMSRRNKDYASATAEGQVKLVNVFSTPLDRRVLSILKPLKIEVLDTDSLDKFEGKIDGQYLDLIQSRLFLLKKKSLEESTQRLRNLQSSSNPTLSISEKLKDKYRSLSDRIKLFNAKAEQLSAKEQRQLDCMHAALKKLQKKVEKEKASPRPTIEKQIEALSKKIVVLEKQMMGMEKCPILLEMDRVSRSKKKSTSHTVSSQEAAQPKKSKFHFLVKRWGEELDLLVQLRDKHRTKSGEDRIYELEYSLAVIGQLFRDIQDLGSEKQKELSSITIDQSIQQTISTRNKDIMHSAFSNLTPQLISCAKDVVTPLSRDVKAILALSDKEFVKKIHDEKGKHVAHLNNLGMHYIRLGKCEEALTYLKQAYDLLFVHDLEKDHGISGEVAVFEVYEGDTTAMANALLAVVNIPGRGVILKIPKKEALWRYELMGNIAIAMIGIEKAYEEVNTYVEHARYIFNKTAIHTLSDFSWRPLSMSIWISHKCNPRTFNPDEYKSVLLEMRKSDYSVYASLVINVSSTQNSHSRKKMLQSLDLKQITLASVQLAIHTHMASTYLDVKIEFFSEERVISILNNLESAKEIWLSKQGQLIDESGDDVRDYMRQLQDVIGKCIIPIQPFALRTSDGELLERCLEVCKPFEIDTGWLKCNLMVIYSNPKFWKNQSVHSRYFLLMEELKGSDNFTIKTKAMMCMVYYYDGSKQTNFLLNHLLFARECYIQLSEEERSGVPEYQDYESILNKFISQHPDVIRSLIERLKNVVTEKEASNQTAIAEVHKKRVAFLTDCLQRDSHSSSSSFDPRLLAPKTIKPGDRCKVFGLIYVAEYNGLTGIVEGLIPGKGRYQLLLDHPLDASNPSISIRASNLMLIQEAAIQYIPAQTQ